MPCDARYWTVPSTLPASTANTSRNASRGRRGTSERQPSISFHVSRQREMVSGREEATVDTSVTFTSSVMGVVLRAAQIGDPCVYQSQLFGIHDPDIDKCLITSPQVAHEVGRAAQ